MRNSIFILLATCILLLIDPHSADSESIKKNTKSKQPSSSHSRIDTINERDVVVHGYIGILMLTGGQGYDPKGTLTLKFNQQSVKADIGKSKLIAITNVLGDGISLPKVSIASTTYNVRKWTDVLFKYNGSLSGVDLLFNTGSLDTSFQKRTLTMYFDDADILKAVNKDGWTAEEIESANKQEMEIHAKNELAKTPRGKALAKYQYHSRVLVKNPIIVGHEVIIVGNTEDGIVTATSSGVIPGMPENLDAENSLKIEQLTQGKWTVFATRNIALSQGSKAYFSAYETVKNQAINYLTLQEEQRLQQNDSSKQSLKVKRKKSSN